MFLSSSLGFSRLSDSFCHSVKIYRAKSLVESAIRGPFNSLSLFYMVYKFAIANRLTDLLTKGNS